MLPEDALKSNMPMGFAWFFTQSECEINIVSGRFELESFGNGFQFEIRKNERGCFSFLFKILPDEHREYSDLSINIRLGGFADKNAKNHELFRRFDFTEMTRDLNQTFFIFKDLTWEQVVQTEHAQNHWLRLDVIVL
jgi:hypothetical protein